MGLYDRDYYRQSLPRGGFGHFSAWSANVGAKICELHPPEDGA
jgi:hypothetical protein